MIKLHKCGALGADIPFSPTLDHLPPEIVWVDILNGEESEIEFIERQTKLKLPTLADLSEIESSSRLRFEHGVLFLSAPIVFRNELGEPATTPLGFVLTRERLITIRFRELSAFASFAQQAMKPDAVHHSSDGALAGLLEAIVDRMADVLEIVGSELDTISHRVFRSGQKTTHRRPAREETDLRVILSQLGRAGDLGSRIRDSLLSLSRIVPYVISLAGETMPAPVRPHLETLKHDIASLNDYEGHLTTKLQLLLDATLGFINVEQNNIIKVLTIVSLVGVPPTLVASMYGMNFHDMPELSWTFGYPYALGLIVLSAIGPLLWFKIRGWI